MSKGEIRLREERIDNLNDAQMRKMRGRKIGAIFQDPLTSLNPLYTVGQQLVETIQTHLHLSTQAALKRAVDLLKATGIPAPEERIDHYPPQFSGCMRQRVVIALALAAEPELIVADEPTTALDVSIQAQILELLKKLCQEQGTAILLITHDMGVIADIADRVAVMYAGRLIEIGPVEEMIRTPKHRSEEHTSELQSRRHLVCRLLLEKKKSNKVRDDEPLVVADMEVVDNGQFDWREPSERDVAVAVGERLQI